MSGTVFVTEEMDSVDSDILEIAAYGELVCNIAVKRLW